MEWLQNLLGDGGVKIWAFFTYFGEEYFMVAALCVLYWCINKEAGVFVGTNLLADLILNPFIKNIALRRRPYMDNPGVKCLRPVHSGDIYDIQVQGFSFPSAHSSNSFTLYGSIAMWVKKRWFTVLVIVLAFLIGFSRVFLGVHYPTDILAGWALGAAIMFLVSFLQRKIKDKRILYLIIFLCAVPGFFFCRTDDYFTGVGIVAGFFLGVLFEERYVNFKVTRIVWRGALRVAIGMGLFLGLNTLLKLPFPKELLEAANVTAYLIRTCRYAVVAFTIIGLYPLSFRFLDGKLKKNQH